MKKYVMALALAAFVISCGHPGKIERTQSDIGAWYAMELGDTLRLNYWDKVVRVPGGWVISLKRGYGSACAFIPYSDPSKED